MKAILVLGLLLLSPLTAAELRVSTDFEGGSATIDAIDSERREIQIRPGGNPARGWPCWWFVRIDGLGAGETATLVLRGSERPARNNGMDTGKPLASDWAMPIAAAVSDDGKTWRQTGLGTRETDRISYPLEGSGGPLWVAWGPPFTPRETEALITGAAQSRPDLVHPFTLAKTREGRAVRALRIVAEGDTQEKPAVWIHARQHAWESGSSWVARGFVEWLLSDAEEAKRLREQAEIVIVPIMDVDRVVTGDGGKEADPHDHNRDWSETPHYPEVAAAQDQMKSYAAEGRLAVFLDLHNPASRDLRPFFFVGPPELLSETARANRERFLNLAVQHLTGPLTLEPKPRVTGASYHPLWRRISGQWVNDHGNGHTLAACLETTWNTRHSTSDGYRTVGRQLGEALAAYLSPPAP